MVVIARIVMPCHIMAVIVMMGNMLGLGHHHTGAMIHRMGQRRSADQ